MESIVRIKFGSHLYGTSTPESDLDYKSVHIPDADDILLQRVKGSICDKRPKGEGEKNFAGEVDEESYSLQRYLELLTQGQTVAIDMLFAPAPEHTSALWKHIQNNREKLLTKKSAAFVGYCRTQANKYGIKGSRVAAARIATDLFEGLVSDGKGTTKVYEWEGALEHLAKENPEHIAIVVYEDEKKGKTETYFECCNRKVPFTASVKLAHEIYSKVRDAYGQRAQLAEQNEGVDWKALSHAVRVGEEALELLGTGNITFPLANAPQILAIKQGEIEYAVVAGMIEKLLFMVEQAAETSSLREEPDYEWIDELVKNQYGYAMQWDEY